MGTIKQCSVKNRSIGVVTYKIPDINVKRSFMPGETKIIDYDELVKLTYQPGGRELMENYLQIKDATAIKDLDLKTEPEYNMSEEDIIELLKNGSLDEFLDALDFAPPAVIDIIKTFSVQLPLESTSKRKALKEKIGFDVERAIANSAPDVDEEPAAEAPHRRVVKEEKPEGRRTTPKYNIVEK